MAGQDLVLAMSAGDTMFHVGTRASLLRHLYPFPDPGDEVTRHHQPELYDAAGHRLRVTRDAAGRALALEPTGVGDADPDDLVGRLDAVLARARERVRAEPAGVVGPDDVPGASGPLPAVLAMLDAYGSGPAPGAGSGGGVLGHLLDWVRVSTDLVVTRVPMLARRRPWGGPTVPTGDLEPADPVPHTGSWFHNLMHRLSG